MRPRGGALNCHVTGSTRTPREALEGSNKVRQSSPASMGLYFRATGYKELPVNADAYIAVFPAEARRDQLAIRADMVLDVLPFNLSDPQLRSNSKGLILDINVLALVELDIAI